ncbi:MULTISPECIES: hypothetical protein [Niabella]|uniref:Uncharacterized protein n=2 Tax=Niabella TaxID=379899 RepID=W0F2U2_9BACT|nr:MULTISPECIES: hypothetical protein [Niabella]AHF17355.1 hypothetical protein NIASO_05995 [Niabella soli DSM 19437]SDC97409.1 hypothetical protein SAMN04487894_10574 [Niabella drilacis]
MHIPVQFEFEGKKIFGELRRSKKMNSRHYRLYINNREVGEFFKTERFGWQYTTQQGYFPVIAMQLLPYVDERED